VAARTTQPPARAGNGNGNGHGPAQVTPTIIMPLDGTRSDAAAPKKKTRVRPKSRQKKGQTA